MTSITSLPPNLQGLLTEASQPGANLGEIKGKLLKEINALDSEQVGSVLKFLAAQGENQDVGLLTTPGAGGRQEARGANEAMGKLDSEAVATDIYSVMALIQKLAQEQRNTARTIRDSSLEQQVTQLKSAANEIRNAAQDRFVGSVVASSMQIGAGMVQIGAGAVAASQANKAMGMTDDTMQKHMLGQSDRSMAFGKGTSSVLEGVGGVVRSSMELQAAAHDAKKSDLEAQSKMSEVSSQQANDFMQQMMEMIRDVRDKLSSIEQSNIETNRGIARNI